MQEYNLRITKKAPKHVSNSQQRLSSNDKVDEWRDRFRVYFPSEDTVKASRDGPRSAGTICFQSRWYEGVRFPRHTLRDCESQRPGLLMHNKVERASDHYFFCNDAEVHIRSCS